MSEPRAGDKVYRPGLKQSNGYILRVLPYSDEVHVMFHDTLQRKVFSLEEFDGRWTHLYGGLWYLEEER